MQPGFEYTQNKKVFIRVSWCKEMLCTLKIGRLRQNIKDSAFTYSPPIDKLHKQAKSVHCFEVCGAAGCGRYSRMNVDNVIKPFYKSLEFFRPVYSILGFYQS